jgi:arabinofuranosyltransferase
MRAGEPRPVTWAIALGGAGLLAILFVRTAWMCDDAYITLRTVDNLIGGFGLRWNVAERVQAFTHPAWALFVAPFYAITREAYFTVLVLQISLATLTVAVCGRLVARSAPDALLGFAAFAGSKAFVDFSTSGLENALVHLLVVLFVIVWRREGTAPGGLSTLGLLTSGLLLCRLDLAALVAPMVFVVLRPVSRARLTSFLVGLAPLAVWELFSLIYYGQFVANTALAKLPAGVSVLDLAGQGVRYFAATFHFDPMTPLLLAVAVAGLVWRGGRSGRAIAAGAVLHGAYIVSVGGDFMTGRFLTPAFVLAVVGTMGLVRWPGPERARVFVAGLLVVAGLIPQASPLRTGSNFGEIARPGGEFDRFGVTDERRFYYPSLGLVRVLQGRAAPAEKTWAVARPAERDSPAGG